MPNQTVLQQAIVADVQRVLVGQLMFRFEDYRTGGGCYGWKVIYHAWGGWKVVIIEAGLVRRPPPQLLPGEQLRRCLGCEQAFPSTSPFHRVCQECKQKPSWRE